MGNSVSNGNELDYTPGADVAAGDVVVRGELVTLANAAIASGELGSTMVEGVVSVAKDATEAMSDGEKIWWNVAGSKATTTASTHKQIGWAIGTYLAAATIVEVKLGR